MSLNCHDVQVSYGNHPVLQGVTCELPAGTVTALFGPNGVGKSTLFKAMLGHLKHHGEISLEGANLARWSSSQRAQRVAYVPQHNTPSFPYSTIEMVMMGRTPRLESLWGPTAEDEQLSLTALDEVGLRDLAARPFTTLSGGQQQLALLARAIATECDYYLLDEPTASLDFHNQVLVWQAVRRLAELGRGVFVCTHDPNHALWFCDRVVVLGRDGRVADEGPAVDVLNDRLIAELYPDSALIATVDGIPTVLPRVVGRATSRPSPAQGFGG